MTLRDSLPGRLRPRHFAAACLAALFATLALPAAALAHTASQSEKPTVTASRSRAEIVQLEKSWLRALQAGDVAELDRILAPDFVRPLPGSGSFIGKTRMLAYFRRHPGPRAMGAHFTRLNVWVYRGTAIARGILTSVNPRSKQVRESLFTDVFIRRQGRWQAVSAQENSVAHPPPAAVKKHR